jgi:hypothetical protein
MRAWTPAVAIIDFTEDEVDLLRQAIVAACPPTMRGPPSALPSPATLRAVVNQWHHDIRAQPSTTPDEDA